MSLGPGAGVVCEKVLDVDELQLDMGEAGEAEGGVGTMSCGEPWTTVVKRTRWEIHERSADRMVNGRKRRRIRGWN